MKVPKLKIRESKAIRLAGKCWMIKKLSISEFSLWEVGQSRVRFGNRKEIEEDLQHIKETGVLPRSQSTSVH